MKTVIDIIEAFDGPQRLAELVNKVPQAFRPANMDLTPTLIYQWKHRNAIHSRWYPALVRAAKSNDIDVSSDDLINHVVPATRGQARDQTVDQVAA